MQKKIAIYLRTVLNKYITGEVITDSTSQFWKIYNWEMLNNVTNM